MIGGAFDWSLPLFRFRGIDVRAHWTLLLMIVFDFVTQVIQQGRPWWLVFGMIGLLFLSVLLHEFGHAFTARRLGGACDRIILWMLGGLAECNVPQRPWPMFAVAAAGPLVSAALAAVGYTVMWTVGDQLPLWLGFLVWYLASTNLMLLLFNLVPCFPLDGGRMAGAVNWTLFGARKAIVYTFTLSLVSGLALFGWLVYSGSTMGVFILVWLAFTLMQEHAKWRTDADEVLDIPNGRWNPDSVGLYARWQARRAERQAEATRRERANEQEDLDRLLAKVTAQGLPSLTAAERRRLADISKRQREREGRS